MRCLNNIPHALSQQIYNKAFSLFFKYPKSPNIKVSLQKKGEVLMIIVGFLVCSDRFWRTLGMNKWSSRFFMFVNEERNGLQPTEFQAIQT